MGDTVIEVMILRCGRGLGCRGGLGKDRGGRERGQKENGCEEGACRVV